MDKQVTQSVLFVNSGNEEVRARVDARARPASQSSRRQAVEVKPFE
jgi:hypothetical protein